MATSPTRAEGQYHVKHLEQMFHDCFFEGYATVLSGGHSEPIYLPADEQSPCQLRYREDYFSSALHEVAHWCIAGPQRRMLTDFGYWYKPDGRDSMHQVKFERVEARPQALEWVFSVAAGAPFQISSDNFLAGQALESTDFACAVYQQVQVFIAEGLPARGEAFAAALTAFYGTTQPLDNSLYRPILFPAV